MTVTLADIEAAARTIEGRVVATPFLLSRTLSDITGAQVMIKFENLQFTASFKDRGALNKLASLSAAERARGVIANSAGNHAQGLAHHAERLRIPATIVMPEMTPFTKVKQTQGFGAEVFLKGANLSEAGEAAHKIAQERGLTFVHPYDDEMIIAGQGTIGLELARSGTEFDTVIVPLGGGGLISGIAVALDALKPGTKIVGVESEMFPAMRAALIGMPAPCGGSTIAEGIAVPHPGRLATEICRRLVEDVVLVSEAAIERAIYLLLTIEKTVAEGAGAAGLAALLQYPERFRGRRVAIILAGGNIDARLLASVIMRELSRDGRIFKIAVAIEDLPGQLSRVARAIGDARGSILEVQHSRLSLDISAKHTLLECLIEARDREHGQEICAAIEALGIGVRRMS
jgi:threonine dehydratase